MPDVPITLFTDIEIDDEIFDNIIPISDPVTTLVTKFTILIRRPTNGLFFLILIFISTRVSKMYLTFLMS